MPRVTPRDLNSGQVHQTQDVYRRALSDAATAMMALMGVPVVTDALRPISADVMLASLPAHSCATSFALSGGTAGTLIVASDVDDTAVLAARLLGKSVAPPLDARARGAFDEVGNIIASQFLNSVASVLGVSCLPSVPYSHTGTGPELVKSIYQAHTRVESEETVASRFTIGDDAVLLFLHMPAAGTTAEITDRLAENARRRV